MADPLGLISGSSGSLGGVGGPLSRPTERPDPGAPSFKDILLNNIKDANKLQQEATTAIEDLATGKRNDVEGVMVATQKADMAFKMLLQVRNKVQAAFEEIKQLRV